VVVDADGEVLRVVEKRYVNGSKGRCRIVFQTLGKNARMNIKRKIKEVVLFVVRDICLVGRSELQWGEGGGRWSQWEIRHAVLAEVSRGHCFIRP